MIASASNTTIRFGNFFMAPCLDSQARGFDLTGGTSLRRAWVLGLGHEPSAHKDATWRAGRTCLEGLGFVRAPEGRTEDRGSRGPLLPQRFSPDPR